MSERGTIVIMEGELAKAEREAREMTPFKAEAKRLCAAHDAHMQAMDEARRTVGEWLKARGIYRLKLLARQLHYPVPFDASWWLRLKLWFSCRVNARVCVLSSRYDGFVQSYWAFAVPEAMLTPKQLEDAALEVLALRAASSEKARGHAEVEAIMARDV